MRMRIVFGLLTLIALAGCWEQSRPQTPEECKVTTDPEACRKAYRR